MTPSPKKHSKVLIGCGPSKVRSIRLPVSYWRALKKLAAANGTSINGEIAKSVQGILRSEGAIE